MHFAFILYGARTEIERLYRDMEAQKFQLRLFKPGEEDKHVWINGQIRILPLGVVEYVFPRECLHLVLNTMCKQLPNRYGVPTVLRAMFKKALKLEALPKEYKQDEKLLWCIEHVSIMPIGIRKDLNLVEVKDMGYKGWTHESI